jgi:pullulanase/glycogen debranching enzyme
VIFNSHWESQRFNLPHDGRWCWRRLVDTNLPSPDDIVEEAHAVALHPADHYIMSPRSAVILIGPFAPTFARSADNCLASAG